VRPDDPHPFGGWLTVTSSVDVDVETTAGRILRPCKMAGCPNLVDRDRRYCERHATAVEQERKEREPWRGLYNDRRWKRTVATVRLRAGGRCEWQEAGVRCDSTVGLQAHHLDAPGDEYRATLAAGGTTAEALAAAEQVFFNADRVVLACRPHHQADDTRRRKEADA